jgi:hypothetical protein
MAATNQIRRYECASAMLRHLHRGLVTGDTNSRARDLGDAARNPHPQKQMRAPTPTPRPAATAAGKFNSATTLQRNSGVCSRLQRRVTGASGSPHTTKWANQLNFPAAVAAPQPCAPVPLSSSVLKPTKRRVCGSASTGRGTGGGGCLWGWGLRYEKSRTLIHRRKEKSRNQNSFRRAFQGRIHQGQKEAALVAMQIRVSVSQGGQT